MGLSLSITVAWNTDTHFRTKFSVLIHQPRLTKQLTFFSIYDMQTCKHALLKPCELIFVFITKPSHLSFVYDTFIFHLLTHSINGDRKLFLKTISILLLCNMGNCWFKMKPPQHSNSFGKWTAIDSVENCREKKNCREKLYRKEELKRQTKNC